MPGLQKLTAAIHAEGAAISAQIGHAGPVQICALGKAKALAPGRFFNPLVMSFTKKATRDDIDDVIAAHADAARFAIESRLRRGRDPPWPRLLLLAPSSAR